MEGAIVIIDNLRAYKLAVIKQLIQVIGVTVLNLYPPES
jgi:hypothetical protein